jgi:hypothetical protein
MQSKKTLVTLSIITVLVLIFFGFRTTKDTPPNDEPAAQQSHQTQNAIAPEPATKDELTQTQSVTATPKPKSAETNEQALLQKDANKTAAKPK